jgi:hypothetical protein
VLAAQGPIYCDAMLFKYIPACQFLPGLKLELTEENND